jgi:hypothetical protein
MIFNSLRIFLPNRFNPYRASITAQQNRKRPWMLNLSSLAFNACQVLKAQIPTRERQTPDCKRLREPANLYPVASVWYQPKPSPFIFFGGPRRAMVARFRGSFLINFKNPLLSATANRLTMADDTTKRDYRDRDRINVHED